jgi:steroid 5-alpha reductase family enzyme
MLRTAFLLVLALVVLPIVALRQDAPLESLQWAMLRGGIVLAAAFALYAFVASELTRNYSQVDRLWSIVPAVFSWYFAGRSGWNARLVLMASLVTLWAVRLTFNFWRRGGFSWPPWRGIEDYRWEHVRQMPGFRNPHAWRLFNFGFISAYQLFLLLLITVPSVVAAQSTHRPLNALDAVAAVLFVTLLTIETVADQQQFEFQTEKHRRRAAGEPLTGDYVRGFRTTGLFGLARRPNFAAEQAIWVTYYLFSVAATGRWVNWSAIGALLLILLFQGSTDLTEKITASKYPAYADYQRRVPRFLPRPWGRRPPTTETVGS